MFLRRACDKRARKPSKSAYASLRQWNCTVRRSSMPCCSSRRASSSRGKSTCRDEVSLASSRAAPMSTRRSASDLASSREPRTGVNGTARSEEHTSELQSLTNLVCRLLLEKKKNNIIVGRTAYQEPRILYSDT